MVIFISAFLYLIYLVFRPRLSSRIAKLFLIRIEAKALEVVVKCFGLVFLCFMVWVVFLVWVGLVFGLVVGCWSSTLVFGALPCWLLEKR